MYFSELQLNSCHGRLERKSDDNRTSSENGTVQLNTRRSKNIPTRNGVRLARELFVVAVRVCDRDQPAHAQYGMYARRAASASARLGTVATAYRTGTNGTAHALGNSRNARYHGYMRSGSRVHVACSWRVRAMHVQGFKDSAGSGK